MAVKLIQDGDTIFVTDDKLGVPNGDPETKYEIKLISRAVYKSIIAKNTERVVNRANRGMEDVTDWREVSEDLLDYALVGWTGILLNGEPAECSRANKMKLDTQRAQALLDKAGVSQVESQAGKESSFRGITAVR